MTERRGVAFAEVAINGQWPLLLPDYRADRIEWTSEAGWERERWDSIAANVGPGDVVYDVGTEEGDLTALLSRWTLIPEGAVRCDNCGKIGHTEVMYHETGPQCRWCGMSEGPPSYRTEFTDPTPGGVVMFEPNWKAWPNVKAIHEANGLPAPRAWFHGLASDTTGYAPPNADVVKIVGHTSSLEDGAREWPDSADGPLTGQTGFKSLVESGIDLPNITLDDFAARSGLNPDAITMDVEGAELRVLEGAARLLREVRPLVWVSVHPAFIAFDYEPDTSDGLHCFMARLGYRMQLLAVDHEHHWFYWPQERNVHLADVAVPT